MMRLLVVLLMIVLAGCNGRWVEGRWVEDRLVVEARCPGGRVDVERRTTNVIAGQTRNTIVRTNACLE